MNASFTPDLLTVWNLIYELPLLSSPHLVGGPVACLAHSLLSLGFTLAPDLCARGIYADLLHFLWSPLSHWTQEAEVSWLHQAVSKEPRSVWQGSQPCFPLWKSMCASHNELPPLSLSFRVGKLLSASALANIRGSTHSDCEFCGSSTSDTRHLVDECPAFSQTRDNHGYSDFCNAPLLTRCAGIPSFCAPPALDAPVEGPGLANVPVGLPFFTDGSALSPDLPVIRAASWSIVVALPDGTFPLVYRGLLPGSVQTLGELSFLPSLLSFVQGALAQYTLTVNTSWTESRNSVPNRSTNYTGSRSQMQICGKRSCLGWWPEAPYAYSHARSKLIWLHRRPPPPSNAS